MQKYNNIVQNPNFYYNFNEFVEIFYKTIIFAQKINLWLRKKYLIHLL